MPADAVWGAAHRTNHYCGGSRIQLIWYGHRISHRPTVSERFTTTGGTRPGSSLFSREISTTTTRSPQCKPRHAHHLRRIAEHSCRQRRLMKLRAFTAGPPSRSE